MLARQNLLARLRSTTFLAIAALVGVGEQAACSTSSLEANDDAAGATASAGAGTGSGITNGGGRATGGGTGGVGNASGAAHSAGSAGGAGKTESEAGGSVSIGGGKAAGAGGLGAAGAPQGGTSGVAGSAGLGGLSGGGGATQTLNCLPIPNRCGFPDASNTGVPAGTPLTKAVSCKITKDNAVLDAQDFACNLEIYAKNVKITRSRIHPASESGVYAVSTDVGDGSLLLEDSEISGAQNGIGYSNVTCRRCNIHGFSEDAVKLGSNTSIIDSYIHGFASSPGAHADGAQLQAGEENILILHNTIDGTDGIGQTTPNSALFIAPDLGPTSDGPLTIENNLLAGGNFTIQIVDGNDGKYFLHHITLKGNRFRKGSFSYGPLRLQDDEAPFTTVGNNVWDEDGTPMTF